MGCRRARRVVFLWVDRDHESLPLEALERHLDECPECRERAGRIERAVLLVRERCRREPAPSHLAARIRVLLGDENR